MIQRRSMRMKHFGLLFFCCITVSLLSVTSCLTKREVRLREFSEAPLFGMVYDNDHQPCSGALLFVDGEKGPSTDINGRFVIGSLSRGTHRVQVQKEGFEELEVFVDFLNKSQVLYLRVISFNQLLREVEQMLMKKRLLETEELLARAEAIYADDPVALYLKVLYLLEIEEPREAVRVLETVLQKGYREPVVYLSLADIYQYRLEDTEKAASQLQEYLKIQKDSEVQQRLDALTF